MALPVKAVVEYNEDGFLIYASNFAGAYGRGKTKEEALGKFTREIPEYRFEK